MYGDVARICVSIASLFSFIFEVLVNFFVSDHLFP